VNLCTLQAIAAIPALLILAFLYLVIVGTLGGTLIGLRNLSRAASGLGEGTASSSTRVPDENVRLLESAGEDQRLNILRSLITGAGNDCVEVVRASKLSTTATGQTVWQAACFRGKEYSVLVSPDGRVGVAAAP